MTTQDDPLIWHYTSLETLALILKDGCFHAAEASFHNDPSEAVLAEDTVREFFEEKVKASGPHDSWEELHEAWNAIVGTDGDSDTLQVRNPADLLTRARFILCASSRDNFHMWRTYASVGQIPCAIGLDRDMPLRVIPTVPAPQEDGLFGPVSPRSNSAGWTTVDYDSSDVVSKALGDLYEISTSPKGNPEYADEADHAENVYFGILDAWLATRNVKHSTYRFEEESRLVFEGVKKSDVHLKEGINGPRPYIKVGASGEDEEGRLPIREIMLGPTVPVGAPPSAQWLLALNGYENVRISRTEHKFREV